MIAILLKASALGFKVFDDAVMYHRNQITRDMRMRVWLSDAAVGRPAGVTDAGVTIHAALFGSGFHQGNTPHSAHAFESFIGLHCNTR